MTAARWLPVLATLVVAPRAFGQTEPPARPEDLPAVADSWTVPIAHGLGLMTVMRLSEAVLWPDPFAETDLDVIGDRYSRAFTEPPLFRTSEDAFEWDGDPYWLNLGGHALFGSELYLRSRSCRRTPLEALLVTTAGSIVWEYGFEANGVQPSGFDLAYTPIAGLLLGEARYALGGFARRISSPGLRSVVVVVLDPLGELERALGVPC